MYDMHIHTTFSHDGKSDICEYTSYAAGFFSDGIGFAEHVDFMPECGGYGLFDYKSYMATVLEYRDKGFEFHAGAEIDYARCVEEDIRRSLEKNPFEYTICSVHMINGLSVSTNEHMDMYYDQTRFKDMLEKYYLEISSGIKSGLFDVVGHPGIYKRYLDDRFIEENIHRDLIRQLDDELSRLCASSSILLEVNTSGYDTPRRSTFPDINFLKSYYRYGGRSVCLGSDAHAAGKVGYGFERAIEMLKEIGFRSIFIPWDKNREITI